MDKIIKSLVNSIQDYDLGSECQYIMHLYENGILDFEEAIEEIQLRIEYN